MMSDRSQCSWHWAVLAGLATVALALNPNSRAVVAEAKQPLAISIEVVTPGSIVQRLAQREPRTEPHRPAAPSVLGCGPRLPDRRRSWSVRFPWHWSAHSGADQRPQSDRFVEHLIPSDRNQRGPAPQLQRVSVRTWPLPAPEGNQALGLQHAWALRRASTGPSGRMPV